MKKYLLFAAFFFCLDSMANEEAMIPINMEVYGVSVKNWKDIRDNNIVKQNKDYSCGAASIATLLTMYYRRSTTEGEILQLLEKVARQEGLASFADMERILQRIGFKGIGLAASWEQLIKLKIPVVVYVKHRKQDHFTVVSGIDDKRVKLSDPSLGNRILTRGQFKKMWETRREDGLEGKMLAVLPLDKEIAKNADGSFFVRPSSSRLTEDLILLKQTMR